MKSKPTKPPQKKRNHDNTGRPVDVQTILRFRNGCKNSGRIWWMMKFHYREALTPVHLNEASLEPIAKRREDLGKHNVHTHFPKDRNCEICKRTKITRAPCRRRKGEAVPRADNFGDLITADHKVLSDNCESPKQSSLRSRGAGFSYSMDPGVSVQKQNFTRNPEKLAEVPGAREGAKSHLH